MNFAGSSTKVKANHRRQLCDWLCVSANTNKFNRFQIFNHHCRAITRWHESPRVFPTFNFEPHEIPEVLPRYLFLLPTLTLRCTVELSTNLLPEGRPQQSLSSRDALIRHGEWKGKSAAVVYELLRGGTLNCKSYLQYWDTRQCCNGGKRVTSPPWKWHLLWYADGNVAYWVFPPSVTTHIVNSYEHLYLLI